MMTKSYSDTRFTTPPREFVNRHKDLRNKPEPNRVSAETPRPSRASTRDITGRGARTERRPAMKQYEPTTLRDIGSGASTTTSPTCPNCPIGTLPETPTFTNPSRWECPRCRTVLQPEEVLL